MAPLAALAAGIGEAAAAATAAAGTATAAVGGVGNALALASTVAGVGGSLLQGQAAKKQANFEADQAQKAGAEKLAASTRQAEDTRRKTNILMSNEKAAAAADGGGTTNPTILDIIGDTAGRGEFLANSDIYDGQAAQSSAKDQASIARARGKNAQMASYFDAAATGLKGGKSFWDNL